MKKNITFHIIMQGLSTLLSRFSGLTRDVLTAKFLGAGLISDVFFMSFRIPNSIRKLIGEGPMSATFVPMFIQKLHKSRSQARVFSGTIIFLIMIFASICCGLLIIFTPEFITMIAPGFAKDPYALKTIVSLSRISLPFMVFTPIVGVFGGITNGVEKFFAFGITPLILNFTMIFCLISLGSILPNGAFALSIGVSLGGIIQIIFMSYCCKKYKIFPIFNLSKANLFSSSTKKFFWKLAPITLSQGIFQINMFVDGIFASFTHKMASYLYYSDRLSQFVITIIGHTLGSVSLPMIAGYIHKKETENALKVQKDCVKWSLVWSMPAAMSLFVLAPVIVELIYQRGKFSAEDTICVSNMIKITSCVIPIMSLNKILYSSIYSIERTIVPVLIGLVAVVVNLVSNLILMHKITLYYVIISTSISSCVEFALLATVLRVRSKFLHIDKEMVRTLLLSMLFSLMTAYFAGYVQPFFSTHTNIAIAFGITFLTSIIIYVSLALTFKTVDASGLLKIVRGGR